MSEVRAVPPPAALRGEDDPGARSRRIVDAAFGLLADGGLNALTIRAVLQRSGLSRRAFYEGFAGKDDLVLAVFAQTMRLAADHCRALVAGLPTAMARLERVITHIARGGDIAAGDAGNQRRAAAIVREHLRLAEARPLDLEAALAPLIGLLAELLGEGIAAGAVRTHPPERLAVLVYNLVATTVHAEYLGGTAPDPARRAALAAELWEFCRRAIAA